MFLLESRGMSECWEKPRRQPQTLALSQLRYARECCRAPHYLCRALLLRRLLDYQRRRSELVRHRPHSRKNKCPWGSGCPPL